MIGDINDPSTDYGRYNTPKILKALETFNTRFSDFSEDEELAPIWNKLLLALMDECWQDGYDFCDRPKQSPLYGG